MKTVFEKHQAKKATIPSRTNLRWYIVQRSRLSTLPSRKQTSLWRPEQQEWTSQGAPTYPYFSKPLIYTYIYIFRSHQSPFGPVYTWKTLQVFRINKIVRFKHENTFQNYLAKNTLRIPSRTNHRRHILYHSRLLHRGRKCLLLTVSPPWPQKINLK